MKLGCVSSLLGCWLCLSPPATAGQAAPANPQDQVLRVTTDSVEYCHELLGRVQRTRGGIENAPQEAESLTAEGRRMCAAGHVRRGIARLRRALLMLQASE